jgi:ribosomal protein S18 acetylase RimI-like enzyme
MQTFNGTIRPIEVSDVAAVKVILTAWLRDDEVRHYLGFIESSIHLTLESREYDSHYLIAETEDRNIVAILGYRKPIPKLLPFSHSSNPAELNMLYVIPERRGGQGIGTALVAAMEAKLLQKSYTEIIVRSAKRFERVGWGFYDKLSGFRRVGTIDEPGREQSQVWSKRIST